MTTDHDRAQRAARAAARAPRKTASPIEQYDRRTRFWWVTALATVGVEFYAGYLLSGWVRWALWGLAGTSFLLNAFLRPLANRIRRRLTVLTREQVFRVRKLAEAGAGSIGADHFFDISPDTDRVSFYHGVSFALARVTEEFVEVEREIPRPTMGRMRMEDDGSWTDTKAKKAKP